MFVLLFVLVMLLPGYFSCFAALSLNVLFFYVNSLFCSMPVPYQMTFRKMPDCVYSITQETHAFVYTTTPM